MPYEAKPPVENLANCGGGGGNNPSSGNYVAPPSFINSWPLSHKFFHRDLIKVFYNDANTPTDHKKCMEIFFGLFQSMQKGLEKLLLGEIILEMNYFLN